MQPQATINNWQDIWNQTHGSDAKKTLALFTTYADNPKYGFELLTVPSLKSIYNSFFSMFSKPKPTIVKLYKDEIATVLEDFLAADGGCRDDDYSTTVPFILACIKQEMLKQSKTTIDPLDEINKIFNIINANTTINYYTINAEQIINSRNIMKKAAYEEQHARHLKEGWERLGLLSKKNSNPPNIEPNSKVPPAL